MSRRRSRLCASALPAPPPAPHSPILFKSSQSFVDPRPMRIAPPRGRRTDGWKTSAGDDDGTCKSTRRFKRKVGKKSHHSV